MRKPLRNVKKMQNDPPPQKKKKKKKKTDMEKARLMSNKLMV